MLAPIYHATCQYNLKDCNLHSDYFHNTKIGRVMVRIVMSPHRWRPRFDHRSLCVGFVVDKVALGQVFLWVLWFSPLSVIPPVLHI
jgi:hypothetical protein